MPHRSRLGVIVIDCQGDALDPAMAFWSDALGMPFHLDEDRRYAAAEGPEDQPRILLQRVGHPSRVHLDIETDDQPAEEARLAALGATLVEHHPKGWTIMQAPTGHRFCLVPPQRADFAENAPEYE